MSLQKIEVGHELVEQNIPSDQDTRGTQSLDYPRPSGENSKNARRRKMMTTHLRSMSHGISEIMDENLPRGVFSVNKVLDDSKRIFLPLFAPKRRKDHKKTVYFGPMGKQTINNSILLLLLVITRVGTIFISNNRIVKIFGEELVNLTGWAIGDLSTYISLSNWTGSMFILVFAFIWGMILFFVFPSLESFFKNAKIKNEKLLSIIDLFLVQIKYPTLLFPLCLLMTSGSILGLHLSLQSRQESWVIILFSGLIGIFDSVSACLQISLVARVMPKKFALSITFVLAIEFFINSTVSFIPDLMYLNTFMWVCFSLSIFGACCGLAVPTIDQSKTSVFRAQQDKKDPIEVSCDSISVSILFCIVHLTIALAVYFGLFIFPFYYGGLIWNYKYNGNSTNLDRLAFMCQIIWSSAAFVSPGIGAYLDLEIKRVEFHKKDTGIFQKFMRILQKYFRHSVCLVIGLVGSLVSTFLLHYGGIYPDGSYYYFVSLMFGISLSLVLCSMLVSPILMIVNVRTRQVGITYVLYFVILLFIQNFSQVVVGYLCSTELTMRIIWTICFAILGFFVIVAIFAYIPYNLIQYIRNKCTLAKDPSDKFVVEIDPMQLGIRRVNSIEIPKKKYVGCVGIVWNFLGELILFVFSIVMIGIAAGIPNLIFQFGFSTLAEYNWIKSFYLLLVLITSVVSLWLGFPTFLQKSISTVTFKRTRKAMGLYTGRTIADVIDSNPNLTLARLVLRADLKLWKILCEPVISKKPVILVVPDDIVLKDESDRVTIREFDPKFDYTPLDHQKCHNGAVIINETAIRDKSIYNFTVLFKEEFLKRKFSGRFINMRSFVTDFHFLLFLSYSFFSVFPNIYRVLYKFFCPTCDPALYEDGISFLIRLINFIFGFIIIIPFMTLWREICKFLERIIDIILLAKTEFDKFTQFKTPSDYERLTHADVIRLDALCKHVEAIAWSKAEHIKYVFAFVVLYVKILTISFSTLMLFVTSFPLTNEIIQIYVIVIILEIAVMRYLLQPAAMATTEFNILGMRWETLLNQYDIETLRDRGRSEELIKRMEHVKLTIRACKAHWIDLVVSGWCGFYLKSKTLGTGWMIMGGTLRTWLETDLFTVVPSMMVYFVRKFLNVNLE